MWVLDGELCAKLHCPLDRGAVIAKEELAEAFVQEAEMHLTLGSDKGCWMWGQPDEIRFRNYRTPRQRCCWSISCISFGCGDISGSWTTPTSASFYKCTLPLRA